VFTKKTSKLCELEQEARTISRKIKDFEISVIFQNTKRKLKIHSKSITKNMREEKFESHTSHDSLSSIPYRSNGWSWNPNWH